MIERPARSGGGGREATAVVKGRLTAQLLAGRRARSAEAVVGRVLAIQAQDARGFRLAVRSRSSGLAAADVEHALSDTRSLVVTWLNRGTLHLVAAEDYWWLHDLTTPQLRTGNERRLRQEGVSAAQAKAGVAVVAEAVSEGPQTRGQLRARLDTADVPTGRQALIHVLFAATLDGHVVRGPIIAGSQAFVSVRAWLGAPPATLDRPEALAELARRYLAGHGPASPDDLAKWAGITLGDARRGFAAIAGEVVDVGDVGDGLRALRGPRPGSLSPPRLLGPFDPLLHGWASREPFVGRHAGVVTSNGIFRPTALVDGRVVATWGLSADTLTMRPLERIDRAVVEALVDDGADVARFLGLSLPSRINLDSWDNGSVIG